MEEQRVNAVKRRRNDRQRRRKRRLIRKLKRIGLFVIILTAAVLTVFLVRWFTSPKIQGIRESKFEEHPPWEEAFLSVNEYSRPGIEIQKVKKVYVHYTANPGTDAHQNRNYFEGLSQTGETNASSHFIIGYEGEIVQCVPLDEIAYAVAGENMESISIECCYVAEDGSFTPETYESLIELLKWLTDVYRLGEDDILRHYDSNGKLCPIYYVENEDAWELLKQDVFESKNDG